MKPTTELEASVLITYHAYWDSYLKGDMETFASILADDCHIIGSTEFDVFYNKKDAVDFYSATASQIVGIGDFRNRKINVLDCNGNVMVQELHDFYFLVENEWHFYGHGRISTLFSYKENSWKIVHQHGSFPDSKTEQGVQIGIEKINQENIELREAVKRRTVELQHKNRELEIEAALERVRARTMAMQHSGELADTSSVLFQQIKSLGFEIWSCGFCIWKENDFSEAWMGADSGGLLPPMMIPYMEETTHRKIYEASLRGELLHEYVWEGEPLKMHYAFMRSIPSVEKAIEQLEASGLSLPGKQCYYVGFFKQGYLLLITKEPKPDAGDLAKRFAKVFEQTYTRFLDLQKAEEQIREAQIEAALERVRSKTMAMHTSKDVGDTVAAMFDELLHLGIEEKIRCGIGIIDESMQMEVWTAYWGNKEKVGLIIGSLDMSIHHMLSGVFHAWKNKVLHTSYTLAGEDEKDYYRAINNAENYPAKFDLDNLPKQQFQNAFYFKEGFIYVFSAAQLTTDSVQIFKRFAKVFEQTYTRFLDLQKAELQTREAQIELALERIRARTMAMQHSEELADASLLLDTQVRALGIKTWGCAFNIYGDNESTEWFSSEKGTMPTYKIPRENLFLRYYEEGQTGKLIHVEKYTGAACAAHYDYLCTLPGVGESLRKVKESGGSFPLQQIDHVTYFKYGYLLFITLEPVPDAHDIFIRFAKVFEQIYTRFLDLHKAEEQARESQIQLALERVRARTMAMQHSDELLDAATLLFQQIESLGTAAWNCSFNIWKEDKKYAVAWNGTKNGFGRPFNTPTSENVFLDFYEAAQTGDELYVKEIGGKELELHYEYLSRLPGVGETLAELKAANIALPTYQVFNIAYFAQGYLMFITYQPVPEFADIFKRFAKVFEQTYTRFLDLQKAEAQAREAQVEAALEKVRSRSLAMHKSDEIGEVVWTVVEKLKELNIEMSGGVSLVTFIPNSKDMLHWHANPTHIAAADIMLLPYFDDPILNDCQEARQNGMELFAKVYSKEEKNTYFNYAVENSDFKNIPDALKKWVREQPYLSFSYAIQNHSGIFMEDYNGRVFSNEENNILIRFSRVFEQSYVRFLDLQKAEEQTREATIEATLEKIRSASLAMHHSHELRKVNAVMFEKLNELNVLLGTVGIWLFDEKTMNSIFWAGNDLHNEPPMVNLPYDEGMMKEDTNLKDSWEAWMNNKSYINKRYTFEQKNKYFDYVFANNDLTVIPAPVREMILQAPSHIACLIVEKNSSLFFDSWQGQFYSEASINVLKRVAKVFEQAYVRFLDLQKAEAQTIRAEQDLIEIKNARKKAEDALTELQITQKQLIQSEKMASLGELTAGIAHEIQNPLNFVNNFSEVSNELIDEMNDELSKGDIEEAQAIAADIKQNLEKINHHGKRADAIVKGMLQHSQLSKGQKQLTDINALCDEYLRLAYHGIRAKNKSFNATLKTEFDETIGQINIIPQDIGRVVLNLLTNAFYAVEKQKSQLISSYEPTVVISTKKISNYVEASINDNGNGISPHVLDKIFQPFFTTKPTGQGTGLGLSLAYDIVKAHGGEIKVETNEGEGATFTIQIPA